MFLPHCERPNFTPRQNNRKIIILCILICIFLNSKLEVKRCWTEWCKAFPEISLLIISLLMQFWFFVVVLRYLNCCILSKDLLPTFMLLFSPVYCSWDINVYIYHRILLIRLLPLMVSAQDNTTFTICHVSHTQPIYSPIIPSLQDEVYADGNDAFTVACAITETHCWNR